MLKLPVYNTAGEKVGEQQLDEKYFGVELKPAVVQQVVVGEQANARQVLAHTKTRGEVRGGGKKPWKQKGTGRARHGSSRSPIWRGGGVTFGPRKDANHAVKVNKKMRRKALLMSLSEKVQNDRFIIVDDLSLSGKTKDWDTATKKALASVAPERVKARRNRPSTVVMLPVVTSELRRSTSNLQEVEAVRTDSLNVQVLLGHEFALTTVAGVTALEDFLKQQS